MSHGAGIGGWGLGGLSVSDRHSRADIAEFALAEDPDPITRVAGTRGANVNGLESHSYFLNLQIILF